jgi:pimeloyl-ACP methyl ester carboxylesterase
MDAIEYHQTRRFAKTPFGEIAYVERGSGPVALFLHGYPLNGYQWRDIIERLSDVRRCLAVDLMSAGYTKTALDQDISYPAQARMVAAFLDALKIERLERFITSIETRHTVEIEPLLKELRVPTQIMWGTGDSIFPLKGAYWLKAAIPGAHEVIELPGAKVWFPEEYPEFVSETLREHWSRGGPNGGV